jgi:hypothetical protein
MNNETSDGGAAVPCISLLADDSQFRCTVCGQIGTVGRCCGLDTREPLNDLASAELVAEENRKANRPDGTTEGHSRMCAGAPLSLEAT